jgi:HK97 gp10 family phage protein
MPPKTEVKVVYNHIPELMFRVESGKQIAMMKVVEAMAKDARSRLQPGSFGYETGKARDSIKAVSIKRGKEAQLQGGGDTAPYFPYNEFGTRYRAPAPALVPGYEAHKDEFPEDMFRLIDAPFV